MCMRMRSARRGRRSGAGRFRPQKGQALRTGPRTGVAPLAQRPGRPTVHREPTGGGLTLVVLSPVDPMTRGQLRRMAELARDEGHTVRWEEARGGASAPVPHDRRARPACCAGPSGSSSGTRSPATCSCCSPSPRPATSSWSTTARRPWSSSPSSRAASAWCAGTASRQRPGARDLLFAPVVVDGPPPAHPGRQRAGSRSSPRCRSRTTARGRRGHGQRLRLDPLPLRPARSSPRAPTWSARRSSRRAWSTPTATCEAVRALATAHGATRYFAHRRESAEKLHGLAADTGLEIVRPDLPLELIARRGPIGRTILSFPSTVVHTLPLALAGTDVKVAVCDIDPAWLTANASPRAQGFLSGVTGTARDVQRVSTESGHPAKEAKATG